jgi:hypothetical protein
MFDVLGSPALVPIITIVLLVVIYLATHEDPGDEGDDRPSVSAREYRRNNA